MVSRSDTIGRGGAEICAPLSDRNNSTSTAVGFRTRSRAMQVPATSGRADRHAQLAPYHFISHVALLVKCILCNCNLCDLDIRS